MVYEAPDKDTITTIGSRGERSDRDELPAKSKIEHCYLSHGGLDDRCPGDWVFSQTIDGEGDMVVHMKNKAIISLDEYNELLAIAGREKVEW